MQVATAKAVEEIESPSDGVLRRILVAPDFGGGTLRTHGWLGAVKADPAAYREVSSFQVPGSGFEIVPFIQARPQRNMGGSHGGGLAAQLDHLAAQVGCLVQSPIGSLNGAPVSEGGHAHVMILGLLGSAIRFDQGLVSFGQVPAMPVRQAEGQRHQAA